MKWREKRGEGRKAFLCALSFILISAHNEEGKGSRKRRSTEHTETAEEKKKRKMRERKYYFERASKQT